MKTSNKILSGIFIFIFLVMAAVLGALNYKYAKGHYVLQDYYTSHFVQHNLSAVTHVNISNVRGMEFHQGNSNQLELDTSSSRVNHWLTGDTLFIKGQHNISENGLLSFGGNAIKLTLNDYSTFVVNDSGLECGGSGDSSSAKGCQIRLNGSSYVNLGNGREPDYFGKVSLTAFGNSRIKTNENVVAEEVTIEMKDESSLEIFSTSLRILKLVSDEKTRINIPGKYFGSTASREKP